MERPLRIEVKDSVIDPNLPASAPKKVYYREGDDGRALYKVWVYLLGDDLPYVQSVTYTLHPTFGNPVRHLSRTPSNPNCQLVIWTWGLFDLKATIEDKMGSVYEVVHSLTYDRQLTQEKAEYVRETEALPDSSPPQLKRAQS